MGFPIDTICWWRLPPADRCLPDLFLESFLLDQSAFAWWPTREVGTSGPDILFSNIYVLYLWHMFKNTRASFTHFERVAHLPLDFKYPSHPFLSLSRNPLTITGLHGLLLFYWIHPFPDSPAPFLYLLCSSSSLDLAYLLINYFTRLWLDSSVFDPPHLENKCQFLELSYLFSPHDIFIGDFALTIRSFCHWLSLGKIN